MKPEVEAWAKMANEKWAIAEDVPGQTGNKAMGTIGFHYRMRELVQLLELRGSEIVLDVGGGTGWPAHILSEYCKGWHIVDASKKSIEKAQENNKGNDKIMYTLADYEEWDASVKYDRVLFAGSLQYFEDTQKIIGKVYDCLQSGGMAVFTQNPDLTQRTEENKDVHRRWFKCGAIIDLCREIGFQVLAVYKCDYHMMVPYMFNLKAVK